ncbi:MAG TPA: bifunctional 4-hydroxy-2-oxoglutarate aldolase/2-dehydro-3-deoxy-phosphogluconate aldolase [Micromonosporaceae bacterium]|nr:bifunctional 4-hydroxy-2-oxoglutarate aldolase/2-dehydro-3-deoxy-phosphogluconate aldolase [Micromonosporaceae bacterium]
MAEGRPTGVDGSDALDALVADRVVPVIVLEDASAAAPLADALVAGGLHCAEVTFRTDAAEAALRAMATDDRLVVGAGTVVSAEQVERAHAAGARFIVSPGLSPAVVRRCRELGLPVIPGVATPSEVMAALDEGLRLLKFFPAEPFGGIATVRALAAPFRSVRFVPTGGISAAQLPDYLAVPAVAAVGGSWMVAAKLIAERRWDDIRSLTAEAVAIAAESAPSA